MIYNKTTWNSSKGMFIARQLVEYPSTYHISRKGESKHLFTFDSEKNRYEEFGISEISPEALSDLSLLGSFLYEKDAE